MKILILLALILLPIVQAQEEPIDSTIIRFIQQEEQKTRAEIKNYVEVALSHDREETQRQVDDNKRIIYADLDKKARNYTIRVGIIWFISTLTALICYKFISIQIKRKFVKKGFRDEYVG